MAEHVFAVVSGDGLGNAFLFDDFMQAVDCAQRNGPQFRVVVLKTPDWRGICGNCGKPWIPDCSAVTMTRGAEA